ncbi:Arrestin [Gracilaria domingensis]|nr:Arrestin [Gracilaria domingensis]
MEAALGFIGLGPPCEITVELDGAANRRYVNQNPTSSNSLSGSKGNTESTVLLPLFTETETVSGKVTVSLKDGKQMQHRGIKIEFIGTIEMMYDRENSQEFTSLERLLDDPGTLTGTKDYRFEFTNVEKTYDTYSGINVKLRYFLRVSIMRSQYSKDETKEVDIAVQHLVDNPTSNQEIRMEVGIEDSLHIEFVYHSSKFHLTDLVIGRIYFMLVRINIKRMEMEIRKRESAGTGANVYNETETVMKFEVMDGAPVRGEVIPVRMFLGACRALTPSYRSINNKFSVKYYLNLVLVDETDRRYFKQSEITIWRKSYQTV